MSWIPTEQEMYAMPLHEIKDIKPWLEVVRVPNGWLYTHYNNEGIATTSAFVAQRSVNRN
jgi:hypothetical protein